MLNSTSIEKSRETYVDTKEFLRFLKQNIKANYEPFIIYKTMELFEQIKRQGKFLPCVNDIQLEVNNYEIYNNSLECLLGSKKIVWTVDSFENDMLESLIKLDFLGVKKINLSMFYEIINFLLLEKILLFEQAEFKRILELEEKLYYSILRKGIDNCKIQINILRKKIKYTNSKIIKKMNKLSIIKNEIIFSRMKVILENRYIGLDYKQFICSLFPELYCKNNEEIKKIIKEIEGEFEEEIYNEFEDEIEDFEIDNDIQEEVALFETKSSIKKVMKK